MKKTKIFVIASAFLTFATFHANAQFIKGTLMLGTTIGTTGYSSAGSDYDYESGELRNTGTNTFTFSIGPQIGVFLSPRLVVGATPAFSINTSHATNNITNTNSTTSNAVTNSTTTTVSLGPYVRYYFTNLVSNNWFYAQINGAAGTGSGTTTGNTTSTNSLSSTDGKVSNIFTWNAGASIGMTHFFYKRIGMDVAIGFSHSYVHNYDTNSTNTTNKNNGNTTESTNNYTLNTNTNGVTFGVGFH
jgi:hypothetical protein